MLTKNFLKSNIIGACLVGLAMTFSSCDKTGVAPTEEASLTSFTLLATSAVNSPQANVVSTTNASPTATASTKKSCKMNDTQVATLPTATTNYITANYPNATIERVGKTSEGTYFVQLKNADSTFVGLIFDAAGNFVAIKTHKGHFGTPVKVADLPASITDYVTANYAGTTIEKAAIDSDGKYIVAIKKGDGTFTGLAFDASGVFTKELTLNGKFGRHGKKPGKK